MAWPMIAAAAISAIGGYLSSRNKKQSYDYAPAVLGAGDTRETALSYRDLVKGYLESPPGLSEGEKGNMMTAARRESRYGYQGAKMDTQAYMSKRGIRGPGAAGTLGRLEEGERLANYNARINLLLSEHSIRESDIARRAAVGAQFLWPSEQARGAGKVTGVTSNNPQGWLEGMGMGARFAADWYGGQGEKTEDKETSSKGKWTSSTTEGNPYQSPAVPGGYVDVSPWETPEYKRSPPQR